MGDPPKPKSGKWDPFLDPPKLVLNCSTSSFTLSQTPQSVCWFLGCQTPASQDERTSLRQGGTSPRVLGWHSSPLTQHTLRLVGCDTALRRPSSRPLSAIPLKPPQKGVLGRGGQNRVGSKSGRNRVEIGSKTGQNRVKIGSGTPLLTPLFLARLYVALGGTPQLTPPRPSRTPSLPPPTP